MENFNFCAVSLTHFDAMFLFTSMGSSKETLVQNEYENVFQQSYHMQPKIDLGNDFFRICQ